MTSVKTGKNSASDSGPSKGFFHHTGTVIKKIKPSHGDVVDIAVSGLQYLNLKLFLKNKNSQLKLFKLFKNNP